MPLKTFASIPARAYGFTALSGGNYWMALLAASAADNGYAVKVDSTGTPWFAGSSTISTVASGVFGKVSSTATSIDVQVAANGSTTAAYYYSIATDGTNWYAVGYQVPSQQNVILVKYNSSGVIQWQRKITPNANNAIGYDVEVDSSGNVWVFGHAYTSGTVANQPFVAKYNSSGTVQWQLGIYTGGAGNGFAGAIDSSGNSFLCGQFTSAGAYIMKTNTSGTAQWNQRYSSNNADQIFAATIEPTSGDLYVAGRYGSTTGTFLARLTTAGVITWQRTLNTAAYNTATSIALDSNGNVYLLFGTNQVAKYNSSGTIQWQRSMSITTGSLSIRSISTDATGSIYLFGDASGANADLFMAKLPNDGTKTGTYTVGTLSFNWATSTWTDAAGSGAMGTAGSSTSPGTTDAAGTLSTATPTLTLTKGTV